MEPESEFSEQSLCLLIYCYFVFCWLEVLRKKISYISPYITVNRFKLIFIIFSLCFIQT